MELFKHAMSMKNCRTVCVRKTYRMLKDTVIKTFFEWIPKEYGKWSEADLTFEMPTPWGGKWEVLFRSADSPEDIEKFRGLELTDYWCDEAQELAQDVKMILDGRLSYPKGSPVIVYRSILTTNPCDTEHWIYKMYVENPLPGHVYWRQSARENPHLHKEYYDALEANYRDRPELKRRYVDGEWGAIFSGQPVYKEEFHWDTHVSKEHLTPAPGVVLNRGWDFGLTPACIITQAHPNGQWLVLRELWSDDSSIDEFADGVVEYCNREFTGFTYEDVGDPAGRARSATDETSCMDILASKNIWCAPAETNALLPRLEAVKRRLTKSTKGRPRMLIDPRCRRLIDGFSGGYRYAERGNTSTFQDKPEKNLYSHCLTGDTLVTTPAGAVPIKGLHVGDYVATHVGPRRIIATMNREVNRHLKVLLSNGKVIKTTEDHPFYTKKGIVRADALQYNDTLVGINTAEAREWADYREIRSSSSKESGITGNLLDTLSRIMCSTAASICTGLFGDITTDPFQRNTVSIISTGTRATIESKTFQSLLLQDTRYTMLTRISKKYLNACGLEFWPLKMPQKNGTDQMQAGNGTESTERKRGREERKNRLTVLSVARSIGRIAQLAKEVFVVCLARTSNAAPRVSGSTLINEPVTVYDITVEDAHCFFAEGVLVSNCHDALQYIALSLFGYAEHNPKLWSDPLKVNGVVGA